MSQHDTTAAEHVVQINYHRGYGEWVPYCRSCGWTGSYTNIQPWAEREARKHVAAQG